MLLVNYFVTSGASYAYAMPWSLCVFADRLRRRQAIESIVWNPGWDVQ